MLKSQDDAIRAIDLAARNLETTTAAMRGSAALCLLDARDLMAQGNHDQAVCRARDSLAYSVGIFHPDYKTAAAI
ncbi:hypothetical protein [Ralstonia pseudosolanacearum]|uniref:hypothetical protein n=1 Tax=Ralstonia pseudosolanacearum TaxID=1310165 RepID=UPI004054264A